jgi:hypothetical protein
MHKEKSGNPAAGSTRMGERGLEKVGTVAACAGNGENRRESIFFTYEHVQVVIAKNINFFVVGFLLLFFSKSEKFTKTNTY